METQAAFFQTRCWHCFRRVLVPLLPDHLYGTIMLQTCDGKSFAEARLLDNPVFDSLCELLDAISSRTDPQQLLALLADPIDGQRLSAKLYRCPNCNRKIRPSDNKLARRFATIPVASWEGFKSLSAADQREAIHAACRSSG